MTTSNKYVDFVQVGIIQTTLDHELAWPKSASYPQMSPNQDAIAWQEICKAMMAFDDEGNRPEIVVIPELSLPRTRLDDFEQLVCSLNVIAIVGVDYQLDHSNKIVRNEGVVFVPRRFFDGVHSKYCSRIIFGKTFPAPAEKQALEKLNPSWIFEGDENVYLFDVEQYGKFGISICYDFMDLERALLYRGRVQHLIVIAYNRDLGMFKSLADSISRTTFCNVVVCNTGYHGGSTVISPYNESFRRTLYAHSGSPLFTTQVVKLPVMGLYNALKGDTGNKLFKLPPPGLDVVD